MATIAERLALVLTADVDDAVRGLNRLEKEAGEAIGAADSRMDKLGGSLTRIGAGMLSVGALGVTGLGMAARATSDLNEAVSLTEAIFGDAAGEIGEFSKDAASSIGQSERAAREATASFGGLLQNMGFAQDETVQWSQDLTVLASDLGSAFNTDPADAVLALGSALRGEQEPIRRYNVMLDDASVRQRAVELGLAATTAEVDNNAKAQARLSIIMEQTASVQGNFAETSDGMANAQRTFNAQLENFQAAIGQGVLPVMESLLGKGTSLLEWFNEMDPATQTMISQILTLGSGLLIAGGALSLVVGQAIKMRDNLKLLTTAVKGNAAAFGAAAAVATVALMVYKRWADHQAAAAARTNLFTTALSTHSSEIEGVTAAVEAMTEESGVLGEAMEHAGVSAYDLARSIAVGGPVLDRMRERLEGAALELDKTGYSSEAVGRMVGEMASNLEDARRELEIMNKVTGDAADGEMPDLTDAAYEAGEALGDLLAETEDLTDATNDLSREWGNLTNELLGGRQVTVDAALLVEDIADAVEDLDGKSTAEITNQVLEFVNQLAEVKGAAAEAGVDVSDMSDVAEQGLLALLAAGGASQEAINEVIAALGVLDGMEANARVYVDVIGGKSLANPVKALAAPSVPGAGGIDYDALGRLIQAQSAPVTVPVYLDSRQIAEATAEANLAAGGGYG